MRQTLWRINVTLSSVLAQRSVHEFLPRSLVVFYYLKKQKKTTREIRKNVKRKRELKNRDGVTNCKKKKNVFLVEKIIYLLCFFLFFSTDIYSRKRFEGEGVILVVPGKTTDGLHYEN